jgi:hypothetical protein
MSDINIFKDQQKSKGFLNNVNRAEYESNLEFITDGLWDVEFTKIPDGIYYPGNELISARIKSITPPEPLKADVMSYDHRGYEIIQPKSRINRKGTVVLEFTDFEDGSIKAFLNSWSTRQSDPYTNLGLRKEYLKCNLLLTRFNSSGNAIEEINCNTGLPKSFRIANDYSSDQKILAVQSVTIDFEFCTFKQLNT